MHGFNTKLYVFVILLVGNTLLFFSCSPKPKDWEDFNVLKEKTPEAKIPSYNGKEIPYDEYMDWVKWGEEWFRSETFGNEKLLTDIIGFLEVNINIPKQGGGYITESFFKFFVEAIDELDGKRGNLYTGNGGGYTHDLVISFPPGSNLDNILPLPEKLHTGLDVEAGSAWPLGIIPVKAKDSESHLPYLLDPSKYSSGPKGVGNLPGGGKFRTGFSCALCHYSLDVDWDGKTDLKSARLGVKTEGTPFKPQDAWAIGNQDLHLGWIFVTASNPLSAIFASGQPNKLTLGDAKEWMKSILENYKTDPHKVKSEIVKGVQLMPRGYFDDTPDAIHNPLQYPILFTRNNWPFNYDGVMLNASDRNNNVWTVSFDPSEFVALCNDRGGKTENLLFWREPGIFSLLTAKEYAEMILEYSPAVLHDRSQFEILRDDILGTSDGIPGILRTDATVIIKGTDAYVTKEVMDHPDNKKFNRIRDAKEFGIDGDMRDQMTGMLGVRVITPPDIRKEYNIDELEKKYGLNGDEFLTNAVTLMLNWLEPPTNHSILLKNAKEKGLIEKGYDIFKNTGCVNCHAGPFFTNNTIIPLKKIGTNNSRALATEPLQTFIAPEYDPSTGEAISKGFFGWIAKWLGSKETYGYKVVTLRYLWGTAPYLHDGGVGVTLRPGIINETEDLQILLSISQDDKLYGMGQILTYRENNPESYLRPNAALSLQALLLKSEREIVIEANKQESYPITGTNEKISFALMNIQGIGHEKYIADVPGGEKITALVAFLLSLDDVPGK